MIRIIDIFTIKYIRNPYSIYNFLLDFRSADELSKSIIYWIILCMKFRIIVFTNDEFVFLFVYLLNMNNYFVINAINHRIF